MSNQYECTMIEKVRVCTRNCSGCGFERSEAERRKLIIENGGLQRDFDGLRRLHIKKEAQKADAD